MNNAEIFNQMAYLSIIDKYLDTGIRVLLLILIISSIIYIWKHMNK